MGNVNVRDLRNHGGEVLDRVSAGEHVVIVRAGTPVARLTALPRPGLSAHELVRRRRSLPPVDPEALRTDVDAVLDSQL